jgi:hypothetical protein
LGWVERAMKGDAAAALLRGDASRAGFGVR